MKLNRDNFTKTEYNGGTLYQYVCNDTNFFLFTRGRGSGRQISVFKGSAEAKEEEFTTSDSLEAWEKFEEYLRLCEPEQSSSGGFGKNSPQSPNVLPLLAIKQLDTGIFDVILFLQTDKGEQVSVMNFQLTPNALTFPFPKSVIVADWSDEEIPNILKCEVLLKEAKDFEFQEDTEREVFFFIPKSIIEQGGERGGETQDEGGESGDDGGEGGEGQGDDEGENGKKKKGKGKPKGEDEGEEEDEDGEGNGDGNGEDDDEDDSQGGEDSNGQGNDEDDDEGDGDGGGDDEGDGDGSGNQYQRPAQDDDGEPQPINFGETITRLAEITNSQPSALVNIFDRVPVGEAWLNSNNFTQIKRQLNLPPSMTAREFTQQIINSK